MDIVKDLIPVLQAHNVACRQIIVPRGPALELDVKSNGRTLKVLLLHSDDEIRSIEIESERAVDPMQYTEVDILLNPYLTRGQRLFRWQLREDGHYNLHTWEYRHMDDPDEFLKAIMKLTLKFSLYEPFIEELAQGKKLYLGEVLKELRENKLYK